MPVWGSDLTISGAWAIENQIYPVSSRYEIRKGISDNRGYLFAEGTDDDPVGIADTNLNAREMRS
jgi:hypothetical protein